MFFDPLFPRVNAVLDHTKRVVRQPQWVRPWTPPTEAEIRAFVNRTTQVPSTAVPAIPKWNEEVESEACSRAQQMILADFNPAIRMGGCSDPAGFGDLVRDSIQGIALRRPG